MNRRSLHACLFLLLPNLCLGQDGEATYRLELGQGVGPPGAEVEIPLGLTTTGDVHGVQAVFDWDPAAGVGIDLRVNPELVSTADFATFHVEDDWMTVGLVTLAAPLTGEEIPIATAVVQCQPAQGAPPTPVVFRDGVHSVARLLSNVVTVDLGRSVGRDDGLELVDGSFRCLPPPRPVEDLRCSSSEGTVEVSWSLGGGPGRETLRVELRAGELTLPFEPDETTGSISCDLLAPSGTLSVVSIGAGDVEVSADCSYACQTFSRGDSNDDGEVDVSDAVTILSCLFQGMFCPACLDAADCNDDGRVDTSDAVCVLSCVFGSGVCPAAPFPDCGADPTSDDVECAHYASCL